MERCSRCFAEFSSLAVFCPNCGLPHEPDFDSLIDSLVGERYRIYRRLGRGGLSTVFAAVDSATDEVVAVKVSDPTQFARRDLTYDLGEDRAREYWREMLERMRRECEALSGICHPNIVRFIDTGELGPELRYVALEFLHGRTLREELVTGAGIGLRAGIGIAVEIAAALSEIHSRGIIHRDINPGNVFLTSNPQTQADGGVKLIDFGIAKLPLPPGAPPLTRHSILGGTACYASPEQCQSRELDYRTDIYSLGVLLYEMLAGARPFDGRTPTEIALKQIQVEPAAPSAINPEINPALEAVILRALSKDPELRQQSAEELAQELSAATRRIEINIASTLPRPFEAASESPMPDGRADERLPKKRLRRRALAAGSILAVMMAIAGAFYGWRLLTFTGPAPGAVVDASATGPQPDRPSDADSLEASAAMPGAPIITSPIRRAQRNNRPESAAKPAVKHEPEHQAAGAMNRRRAPAVKAPPPAMREPVRTAQIPPPAAPAGRPSREVADRTQPAVAAEPAATTSPPPARPSEIARRPDLSPPARPRPPERTVDPPISGSLPENGPRDGVDNGRGNEPGQLGPRLLQWSGYVDRERVVRIEMPGLPGTLEIPRQYRDRVGVVEPPGARNEWKYALLRVFGRGNVSIVIRWWPLPGTGTRIASRM